MKQELINVGYTDKNRPASGRRRLRNVRPALALLWCGVLVVLLIAGVNLTNLALVRRADAQKSSRRRHALGASSARVARQLATETVLLTVIGGALGIVLGTWGIESLQAMPPNSPTSPRADARYPAGRHGRGVYARTGRRARPRRRRSCPPCCSRARPQHRSCAKKDARAPRVVVRATPDAPSSWPRSHSRSSSSSVQAFCSRVSSRVLGSTRVQRLGQLDRRVSAR